MRKFLIVKTGSTFEDIAEKHGDFEDMLVAVAGLNYSDVDVFDAQNETIQLPDPASYRGIFIPGSHDMLTSNTAWMKRLKKWIVTIKDSGTPTLGICFGHQAMAEAFGGKVDYRKAGIEIGLVDIQFRNEAKKDELFQMFHEKCALLEDHSQSVMVKPGNAIFFASGKGGEIQALKYADKMWSVQFHPEFNSSILSMYIKHQAFELTSSGIDPYELILDLEDNSYGQEFLTSFIEVCNTNL